MPFEPARERVTLDVNAVRDLLPGRRIDWHRTIDSTMTAAARLAREGCAAGTIVGADEQSAGMGRHGHSWYSAAGAGLYVSFVLKPAAGVLNSPAPGRALPLMMLVLGLAAQDAVSKTSGLAPDLRWPNDVLIEGKKCAGVLAQTEGDAIIAGIGINVGHTEFPGELRDAATSLTLAGARVKREDLLVALARAIDGHCGILAAKGPAAILKMFTRASSFTIGRRVRIDQPGAVVEGVTCGLDHSGFLVVRQDNGVEATILAGGVRPV
jgi:BirA family biotin operon repressor/biotin-[acetyl-CoA-carboxylase] ligase